MPQASKGRWSGWPRGMLHLLPSQGRSSSWALNGFTSATSLGDFSGNFHVYNLSAGPKSHQVCLSMRCPHKFHRYSASRQGYQTMFGIRIFGLKLNDLQRQQTKGDTNRIALVKTWVSWSCDLLTRVYKSPDQSHSLTILCWKHESNDVPYDLHHLISHNLISSYI